MQLCTLIHERARACALFHFSTSSQASAPGFSTEPLSCWNLVSNCLFANCVWFPGANELSTHFQCLLSVFLLHPPPPARSYMLTNPITLCYQRWLIPAQQERRTPQRDNRTSHLISNTRWSTGSCGKTVFVPTKHELCKTYGWLSRSHGENVEMNISQQSGINSAVK